MNIRHAISGTLSILALAWAMPSANAQQAPVKIGFVAELSGPQAVLGQDQYDAFMMVVERNGGKLGGVPVQILREDSQSKPEVASQIVQKLIEKENVPIITGLTASNIAMAVHRPITEKKVFLISSNAGPSPLAGPACSPYQFVLSFQTDQVAEAVGKYAQDKAYKRAYLMAPNYQAGKDLVTGFKRYYKGQVIDEVFTPLNQIDFSVELAQLAAAKPDVVYVFYPGALGISFLRQYQQAGLLRSVPLLSAGIVDGTLASLKELALGVVMSAPWAPDINTPENRRFVAEYEAKYNRAPTMFSGHSYDAAMLLDSAIAKVNGDVSNKEALMAALKAADFKSVRGKFRFGNNNFPIQDYQVQEVSRDAKWTVNFKTVATIPDHVDSYHAQCSMK